MARRNYNKVYINKDNLITIIDYLLNLSHENNFNNPRINENLYKLHHLYNDLEQDNKGYYTTFKTIDGGMNKTFEGLEERFIHVDYKDVCCYKHEIKEMLLYGTNNAEVDITNTVIYIFSKFISKDNDLLHEYKRGDFYTLLPNIPREQQKKLVQIWIQGRYDYTLKYNQLFPITSKFLKDVSAKDENNYKLCSGLYRDKETKLLKQILNDVQVNCHLHDGVYVNVRNVKKTIEVIKKYYGDDVKYKVKDYSKINYSKDELLNKLKSIKWTLKDNTPRCSGVLNYEIVYSPNTSNTITHSYKLPNNEFIELPAYVEQKLYCMILYNQYTTKQTIDICESIICLERYYNEMKDTLISEEQ